MITKLSSWWQKTRTPLEIAIIFAPTVLLIALLIVVITGYIFHWDWTGLVPYTSPPHPQGSDFQPGKTLWDWLQLLIIPVVLAVGGYLFNYTVSQNEQKNAQLQNQTERDIAADNQREGALQSYIDKMSELLLEKQLRESKPEDEVRKIGRVRTLTVLPRLDSTRKRSTLLFLHESGLIAKEDKNIIDLSGADLSGADLSGAKLSHADLSGANLSHADLSGAELIVANLSEADLRGAKLNFAKLNFADLSGADLSDANLSRANLSDTNLSYPNLVVANPINADLSRANLSEANLSGANLSGANLNDANLSGANLSRAKVTTQQLDRTRSVTEVILPDGTKHL